LLLVREPVAFKTDVSNVGSANKAAPCTMVQGESNVGSGSCMATACVSTPWATRQPLDNAIASAYVTETSPTLKCKDGDAQCSPSHRSDAVCPPDIKVESVQIIFFAIASAVCIKVLSTFLLMDCWLRPVKRMGASWGVG
jgi:hypothetical protein